MNKPDDFWLWAGAFAAALMGGGNILDMMEAWVLHNFWDFIWELIAAFGAFTIAYKLVKS